MAFVGARVWEALWPEITGVVAYSAAKLVAGTIDVKLGGAWAEHQSANRLVTWGALGGGALALGYNVAPDFAKGLVFASGVGMVDNFMSMLYARVSQSGAARVRSIPAAPASRASLPAPSGRTVASALPAGQKVMS